MKLHSYLRRGSYQPPVDQGGGGGSTIIVPGVTSIWGSIVSLDLLDAVYISGSNRIAKANASSINTMMCIGFVSSINGAEYTVQSTGELAGFTGLTPGATYYVGKSPGQIWTFSEEDSDFPSFIQVIGRAKTESILLLTIDPGPFIGAPT